MRLKIAVFLGKAFLFITAGVFLGVSLLAGPLGLDHNAVWGTGRISLFGIGALLLAFWCMARFPNFFRLVWRRAYQRMAMLRWVAKLWERIFAQLPEPVFLPVEASSLSVSVYALMGVLVVAVIYFLTITSATLHWTPYTTYFDRLANAFLVGKVTLLEQPPAQLLALTNPYDYRNRAGIAYLWDASLYKDQYSLYWGPVPALLAAGVKLLWHDAVVEDQYMVMFFCTGLVCMLAVLLIHLRNQFFPRAPAWTVTALILLGGLSLPVLWLVNRPSVYEVAISGGQFFLLTGVYALLRAFHGDSGEQSQVLSVWLILAGFTLGAAVNCRLSLAPAVVFLAVMVGFACLPKAGTFIHNAKPVILFLIPLIFWAGILGGYNMARYGSIFETGHRYQLTGIALPADYHAVTSPAYLLPNLYNDLFRPLQFNVQTFPFVRAGYIRETMWPFFIHLPRDYYSSEPVAGMLLAIPALWLVLLSQIKRAHILINWLHEIPLHFTSPSPTRIWVILSGLSVSLFIPILLFISSSMRYLMDVFPTAVLLVAFGWWDGISIPTTRPTLRKALLWVGGLLVLISLCIGILASFNSGDHRFEANNPVLFQYLMRIGH